MLLQSLHDIMALHCLKDSYGITANIAWETKPATFLHVHIVTVWMTISDFDSTLQMLTSASTLKYCCQEPPWNSSQGIFVQLFCMLRSFQAVNLVDRSSDWMIRQTKAGKDHSLNMTERERKRQDSQLHFLLG